MTHNEKDKKYLEFFNRLLDKNKFDIKKEIRVAHIDKNVATYLRREGFIKQISKSPYHCWIKKLSPEQMLNMVRKNRQIDNSKTRKFSHTITYDLTNEQIDNTFYDAIKTNDQGIIDMSIQILKGLGYKIMKPTTGWEEI
jgi:hypothetical protein